MKTIQVSSKVSFLYESILKDHLSYHNFYYLQKGESPGRCTSLIIIHPRNRNDMLHASTDYILSVASYIKTAVFIPLHGSSLQPLSYQASEIMTGLQKRILEMSIINILIEIKSYQRFQLSGHCQNRAVKFLQRRNISAVTVFLKKRCGNCPLLTISFS